MSSENKHMTLRCTPFLLFDGTCAEAMTFYSECFGGDLAITKLGDSPMKDQLPPEKHDRILTSSPPSQKGIPDNQWLMPLGWFALHRARNRVSLHALRPQVLRRECS